ncbi:MAG: hypothetical protein RLZZ241_287 [Bacteroidota bacterium]|jgi:lipid-binding SYLF domain-containing protein
MKHLFFILILIAGSAVGKAQAYKERHLIKDSEAAKAQLLKTNPDLQSYFDSAAGYALFPNVGKGGFFVGGASGNGILFENQKAVGSADLKQLSLGFQFGGQAIIEIIFFETQEDLEHFKRAEFQFSAEASAVAVKSGIAIATKYNDGVAVFALPKAGLMASAAIGGQRFTFKKF